MVPVIIFSLSAEHVFKIIYAPSLQIRVGANPVGMGYNRENGDIYVANSGSHSLSVINGDTNRLKSTILVGPIPYAITYNPANDFIYVINLGENSLSAINANTYRIVKTLQVGSIPSAVTYDSVNQRVYVSNYNSSYVTVINSSNQILANVSVGKYPIDLTYNPSNHGIYVANTGANNVSVINSDTNSVVTNISVGVYPTAVVYNPANDKIYVANRNSDTISVIDGITNTISKTINVPPLPRGLAVNPNTNTIYVAHTQVKTPGVNNITSYSISVIDGVSDTVTKLINLTARPEAMVVSLKSNMLYVTNPDIGSVSVIDGKTNQVMQISTSLPEHAKLIALADLLLVTIIPIILIVFLVSRKSRGLVKRKLNNLFNKARESKNIFSRFLTRLVRLVRKSWIRSGLALTILSLIVMPALVVLSQIHVDQVAIFFSYYSQYGGLEWEKAYSGYINVFVQGAFIVILFLYPPYPAPFSSKQYFLDRGYHAAVVEYDYVKKILYIAVPLFILLTIIPFARAQLQPLANDYLSIDLNAQVQQPSYRIAQGIVFFIVFAGLLKLVFAVGRKKFRLYYAIGCFKTIEQWEKIEDYLQNIEDWKSNKNKPKDEVQKMNYMIKGLNSYNLYLHRHLDLHISDIKSIYAKISRLPLDQKNSVIEEISQIFTSATLETDTLAPARYLYEFSIEEKDVSKRVSPKEERKEQTALTKEGFLTAQPLFNKVRDLAAFAAVIIPLGIAMVELYFTAI